MKFFVESPHTKEECLRELDGIAAEGADVLGRFSWACSSGEHTGYAVLEAKDEAAARGFIPESVRERAKVRVVETLTRKDIERMHSA